MPKKRITMKLQHPNPLFEEWLIDWRDQAIESNSKLQYCYGKALQSLRKYPLPLSSGRECMMLQGFGEKLCKMLDEKLAHHKKLNPCNINVGSCNEIQQSDDIENNQLNKSLKPREYIPVLRSGAWAILLTLYKKSLQGGYPGFMFKREIMKDGQCLCDTSFIKPVPGSYYTAWSSMKTLLEKKLVSSVSSPAKFSLTGDGTLLAHKLYSNYLNTEYALSENEGNTNSVDVKESACNKQSRTPIKKTKTSHVNSMESSSLENAFKGIEYEQESGSTCSNLIPEETFIISPYCFEIILLVDKMEVTGNRHQLDDTTLSELTNLNITYEVRHLKIGDYTWICREHYTKKELVLPYIVERKRMDDFGRSIKDGRFHEQKFRLKQSGIQNVVYLIESQGNDAYAGLPPATLEQAAINTLIHDGFNIKFTDSIIGTIKYFAGFTNILKNIYMGKTLLSCPKENLSSTVLDADFISLMTFHEFNKGASKNRNFTVQDMFVRMLLQLKGISIDKALAIVEKYPTPHLLRLTYNENTDLVNEKILANLEYGTLRKKIGPIISKVVHQLFTKVSY